MISQTMTQLKVRYKVAIDSDDVEAADQWGGLVPFMDGETGAYLACKRCRCPHILPVHPTETKAGWGQYTCLNCGVVSSRRASPLEAWK